ncbi:MAG: penicillin-binding protein 2 [Microbacterium sp.]|uniref:peptidoglycan D,D-transpeptidase FtsI family protein n=1 Tax=Microbacterium sp. TaxID=51671 RepID=UPI002636B073|nr:penicillin-binding protein 2 [Microbacterium sp.]MCX6502273.1 penicillin-binding protein 2 [Microbacterium sp.]
MTTRSTRSPRRRTVVALAVVLAVVVVFVVRLVDIQVVNADEHVSDSLSMGIGVSRETYGTRGSIVDANGNTLAGSILQYDAQLDPKLVGPVERTGDDGEKQTVDWPTIAAEIGTITGQTAEEIQQIVADAVAENPDSRYARLATGLSTEQYRALAELKLPFLFQNPHPARSYPDGAVAGNLVGFVGSDGEPLAGLELAENECLTATKGSVTYEQGVDGTIIPGTETETPAVDGGTVTLTVDRDLQWYMQQLISEQTQNLGALHGQIMVADVATGEIKAAAEYPSVDPNDVDATAVEDRGSRIFRDRFEPGSTFKGLSASIAIDTGTATPTTIVNAAGRESFADGVRVTDSMSHGDTPYTLTGVLIDSSNVGISKISVQIPSQTRYDYLTAFGIGQGSAVGFPGEQHGELRTPDQWDPQTTYNIAFGQGVSTTLPELVGAYQTIANDGVKVPLKLVESCTHADGTVDATDAGAPTQVLKPETATQVQQMLENVLLQGSLAKSVAISGYRIAGKTGTGEIAENGSYKQGVYFTTLIGFAPADDPQYVVAVTLDQPTAVRSSSANAPAFQKAMTQVLKTFRVTPSTSEAVLLPKTG